MRQAVTILPILRPALTIQANSGSLLVSAKAPLAEGLLFEFRLIFEFFLFASPAPLSQVLRFLRTQVVIQR
jgi:hypothetical protein